jgi:hypothetical protein
LRAAAAARAGLPKQYSHASAVSRSSTRRSRPSTTASIIDCAASRVSLVADTMPCDSNSRGASGCFSASSR